MRRPWVWSQRGWDWLAVSKFQLLVMVSTRPDVFKVVVILTAWAPEHCDICSPGLPPPPVELVIRPHQDGCVPGLYFNKVGPPLRQPGPIIVKGSLSEVEIIMLRTDSKSKRNMMCKPTQMKQTNICWTSQKTFAKSRSGSCKKWPTVVASLTPIA